MSVSPAHILAFATKGTATNEELRLRKLLSATSAEFLPFDKKAKRRSFLGLVRRIFRDRPDLVVMEGSGLAGGLACLLGRITGRCRYVVSSGDAVGPFVAAHRAWAGPLFALYERLLCRLSDGFVGWTPYLTGRALTFGAPRAVTACGWAPSPLDPSTALQARQSIRQKLGIAPEVIVFGLAGALHWNSRRRYCYGMELLEALLKVKRPDLCVLIVGDGTGMDKLRQLAGQAAGKGVFLPGQVAMEQVPHYLAAMDVASLPQSLDGVGSFRYTTKISEYAAAGLPMVTGRLPLAYDLDDGSIWRLPGSTPWSPIYIDALVDLMRQINQRMLLAAKARVNSHRPEFDCAKQVERVTGFICELLEDRGRRRSTAKARTSDKPLADLSVALARPAINKFSHDGSSSN